MARVINSDLPSQKRKKLLQFISVSAGFLINEEISADDRNDLISFILLSLSEVEKTVNQSIIPWEKREYWVKADQFRAEWHWISDIKYQISITRTENGWKKTPEGINLLYEKIKGFNPPRNFHEKQFWKGAYLVLKKQN